MRSLPWYAWTGGLYGAFFVATAAWAAPRLGVTLFLTAAIAGQLALALLLDRIGAFGLARVEIGPVRLLGVALVLAGVVLVRR
jgi:transporter family-2 protein